MTRKTPADESNYVMADAEHANELGRLQKLEGVRDPDTINYIETVGVAAGWRCVDIGAGAGSVARHLSSLTGPDGVVIAADMDTRFLGGFEATSDASSSTCSAIPGSKTSGPRDAPRWSTAEAPQPASAFTASRTLTTFCLRAASSTTQRLTA